MKFQSEELEDLRFMLPVVPIFSFGGAICVLVLRDFSGVYKSAKGVVPKTSVWITTFRYTCSVSPKCDLRKGV